MEELNSNADLSAEQNTEKISAESSIGTEPSKDNEVSNALHEPSPKDENIPHTDVGGNNDANKELPKEPVHNVIEDEVSTAQDPVETELEKMHSNISERIVEKETSNEPFNDNDNMDWTDVSESVESSSDVKKVDEQPVIPHIAEDKELLEKECEKINFHHIADLVNDNISTPVETPCSSTSDEVQQKTEFSKENPTESTSQNDKNENAQISSVEEIDEHLNQEQSKESCAEFSTTKDQIENVDEEVSTYPDKKNDDENCNTESQIEKTDSVIENPEDVSEKTISKETEKETSETQTNNSTTAEDKDKGNYNQRENTEFVQVNTENEKDGEDNEKEDETNNRALMEHDPIASDSFEPINNEDREGADEELCIIPDTQREISQVNNFKFKHKNSNKTKFIMKTDKLTFSINIIFFPHILLIIFK